MDGFVGLFGAAFDAFAGFFFKVAEFFFGVGGVAFQAVGGFFFKAAQFAFGGVEFAADAFFEFGDFFFAALAAVVVEFFHVVHDGADFFQHGGFAGFKVCLVVFAHLLLLIGGWKGGQYSKAGRGQC